MAEINFSAFFLNRSLSTTKEVERFLFYTNFNIKKMKSLSENKLWIGFTVALTLLLTTLASCGLLK